MGWPAKLSELIDGVRYSGRKLGALGETFVKASEDNPNYFQLPKTDAPLGYADLLSQRHGLGLTGIPGGNIGALNDHGVFSLETMKKGQAGKWADWLTKHYDTEKGAMLKDAIKQGKISPETNLYGIDAMNADKNTGTAKRAYPALWEYILGQPDAANITSVLSNSNQTRRSTNMAGALERWGDRAGDRLFIDPGQIGPGKGLAYGNLATVEKIGLLNAWNAAHADAAISRVLPYGDRDTQGMLASVLSEGHLDPHAFRSQEDFGQVAGALHQAAKRYELANPYESATAPGADSLRRAAITAEQLQNPGLKPPDLSDRPWLTNGIARAEGGRV